MGVMMNLEFFIECDPPKATAQGSSRVMINRKTGKTFYGKPRDSKIKDVQRKLSLLLAPHAPDNPITEPVSVSVAWAYAWRHSETAMWKNRGARPCDKRPDCDNLQKVLFDTMTKAGFWNDDGLIWSVRFDKYWCDDAGIGIKIETFTSGIDNAFFSNVCGVL